KIGFVLLSNSRNPQPSTRIAVLNVMPLLRAAGFDPHIAYEPEEACELPDLAGLADRLAAEGFRVVVFQKVRGAKVQDAVRRLSAHNIRTVFCVCDLIDPL